MPHHVVVDGSNLATEGRSMPSLQQLDEAVRAYMEVEPDALITVVVDATFGHRIDAKETEAFDAAVANNELVAPPAGAVGRGDAFVLSIADKVNATILTNDSYQEFHGQYAWLFDEGRIIGGKPVPHIGWVFVNRTPVRGPLSRKSMAEGKRRGRRTGAPVVNEVRTGSPEANLPMPVPAAPPPGAVLPRKGRDRSGQRRASETTVAIDTTPAAEVEPDTQAELPVEARPAPRSSEVNELLPFLTFVELHPPGSSVSAVVESYSSHGAYVAIGDVRGYVPLRLMAEPAPRSARELGKVGESVTLVVESFAAARRSIDLAVPALATARLPEPKPVKAASKRTKKAASTSPITEAIVAAAAEDAPVKPRAKRAKKAAAATPDVVAVAGDASDVESAAVADVVVASAEPAPPPSPVKRGGRKRAPTPPVDQAQTPPVDQAPPVVAVAEAAPDEPASVEPVVGEPTPTPARPRGRGRARATAPAGDLPAPVAELPGPVVEPPAPVTDAPAGADTASGKPPRRRKAAAPPAVPAEPAVPAAVADTPAPSAPKPVRRAKKAAAPPAPAAAAAEAPAAPRRGRRTSG